MNDNLSGKCEKMVFYAADYVKSIIFAGVIKDFRYG